MGLWAKIKRLFKIRLGKAIKSGTSNIEVLQYELQESKVRIDGLGDKISSIRADRKVAITSKGKLVEEALKFQKALDLAVAQDDAELGNEAIALLEKNQAKDEVYEQNIQYFDNVIDKLEEQHMTLKAKYEEKSLTFEKLKMQAKFADNMKSINEEIKKNYSGDDFDFSGIESIEKEIEKSVHYETERNERVGAEASFEAKIDKISAANKFESYKKQLAQKDTPVEAGE